MAAGITELDAVVDQVLHAAVASIQSAGTRGTVRGLLGRLQPSDGRVAQLEQDNNTLRVALTKVRGGHTAWLAAAASGK